MINDGFQDVGLYACGARNELSGRTERAEGVVYLSMEQGRMMIGELIVIWTVASYGLM